MKKDNKTKTENCNNSRNLFLEALTREKDSSGQALWISARETRRVRILVRCLMISLTTHPKKTAKATKSFFKISGNRIVSPLSIWLHSKMIFQGFRISFFCPIKITKNLRQCWHRRTIIVGRSPWASMIQTLPAITRQSSQESAKWSRLAC